MSRGTIAGFRGSWMSGLATLIVRREDGSLDMVPCDNAPTVRALEACFGGVIAPGRTVNVDAIRGREIEYGMDDMGLVLGWIRPVEED